MTLSTLSEIAHVLHGYAEILTWPIVALVSIILYREFIRSLLPGAKVKLTISGITLETTLPIIEHSISESLRGENLSDEQWYWLKKLHAERKAEFFESDLVVLRPLRNAGLITHPKGFLQDAKTVTITTLGRLLVEASGHEQSRGRCD